MSDVVAKVRTILGDDPHTIEDEFDAPLVEGLRTGIVGVEIAGMGHLLFVPANEHGPDRALFTQGPGKERYLSETDVVRTDSGVECCFVKNGRGQRRMVVVIEGV